MAAALKLLSLLLLLSIIDQGLAACSLSDLSVAQTETGKVVGGVSEYEVVVTNNCICSQTLVTLRCLGFNSVESVDPLIFKPVDGQDCLVNNGMPIFKDYPIKFKYAWKTSFDFFPTNSQINCS